MTYETVLYERRGRVAVITLNRPDKLNALSQELNRDIAAALEEANTDPEVRSIVMTGAGRAFCAGADMGAGGGANSGLAGRYASGEVSHERTRAMRRLHKPIVAAINGYALGAGFELAITCDMLIASEQAVLGIPEVRHGSTLVTWLPFLVGPMWAKRLFLTGDQITARTAQRIGLVLDVVPHDEVLQAAVGLAERIAMVPPLAVRLNKRMLDGILEMQGLENAMSYARLLGTILLELAPTAEAPDGRRYVDIRAQEGMRAFLEVRDGGFGKGLL